MSKFILTAFADEIDDNLTKQMDVLEQHDIHFIEMRGVNGKQLVKYSLEDVKEIKKQLDARNFKLSAIGSPIGKIPVTDGFDEHFQLFKHTLEIAKIMETKYIRLFSFFIPKNEDPSKYRDEVLKRMKMLVDEVENTDIILLHENEKGIYGDNAERCLDIIQSIDSDNLKVTFDPANFVQCDVETYPGAYELLKKHITYMHIKDALYADHKVVPAGQGDGKVVLILKALYQSGYEGFLSLEPHLGNFTGFADLEPDSPGFGLEEGGPKKFAIAVQALKKIINNIVS